MALSETEIFSRIDEIELANPPVEVEAGVYALMHQFTTGPTLSYEPELRSKVFPEKPMALITELDETIRFLEARSSLAYVSWIEEGRLALLRISK